MPARVRACFRAVALEAAADCLHWSGCPESGTNWHFAYTQRAPPRDCRRIPGGSQRHPRLAAGAPGDQSRQPWSGLWNQGHNVTRWKPRSWHWSSAIQARWQRGCAAPEELLARVEVLLNRLKLVNRALSEPSGAAPA